MASNFNLQFLFVTFEIKHELYDEEKCPEDRSNLMMSVKFPIRIRFASHSERKPVPFIGTHVNCDDDGDVESLFYSQGTENPLTHYYQDSFNAILLTKFRCSLHAHNNKCFTSEQKRTVL